MAAGQPVLQFSQGSSAPSNPAPREMPAFLAAMMQANQKQICTARADLVRKVSIGYLLEQRLRIPIFQRRYCWHTDLWDTLFDDVSCLASGLKDVHPVGRLTCVTGGPGDGRISVIDGQQRNTTAVLLLAAVRDLAAARAEGSAEYAALAARVDGVLFTDARALDAWLSSRSTAGGVFVEEGEALDFAALIPTYCDRASYFAATLPPRAAATGGGAWSRPNEAKQHFVARLRESGAEHLAAVVDAVLLKLEWLFFPIDMSGNHDDGTENLHMIYERLAERDEGIRKHFGMRRKEAANMGAADFVRNLLLGSFSEEADAIRMYKEHWLPIEQAACAAMEQARSGDATDILNKMLEAFLRSQPPHLLKAPGAPGTRLGGQLYPRFRTWLTASLAAGAGEACASSGCGRDASLEDRTANLLCCLKEFALEHLKSASTPSTAPAGGGAAAACRPSADRWRCTRCSFPNSAEADRCSVCSSARPSDGGDDACTAIHEI